MPEAAPARARGEQRVATRAPREKQHRNTERGEDREAVPVADREAQPRDGPGPHEQEPRPPKTEGKKRLTSATATTPSRPARARRPTARVCRMTPTERRAEDAGVQERPAGVVEGALGARRPRRRPRRAPPTPSGPSRRRSPRSVEPTAPPDARGQPEQQCGPDEDAGEVAALDGVAATVVGECEDRGGDAENGRGRLRGHATGRACRNRRPTAGGQTTAHGNRTSAVSPIVRQLLPHRDGRSHLGWGGGSIAGCCAGV